MTILTEEKVGSFVEYIIQRYKNKYRASRIEAIYKMKNEKDRHLYDNNFTQVSKAIFRKACIAEFKKRSVKEKLNLKEHEFIILMDEFLSHFDKDGELLPLTK